MSVKKRNIKDNWFLLSVYSACQDLIVILLATVRVIGHPSMQTVDVINRLVNLHVSTG